MNVPSPSIQVGVQTIAGQYYTPRLLSKLVRYSGVVAPACRNCRALQSWLAVTLEPPLRARHASCGEDPVAGVRWGQVQCIIFRAVDDASELTVKCSSLLEKGDLTD